MPGTVNRVPFMPKLERKKRVAAYARVSTGKDAMLHSLSSQVAYYSELIQKLYRNNHLEKKLVRNTGELPMFYAEGTHPAIIDMDTFEAAQEVLRKAREATKDRHRPQKSELTGKVLCPLCGKAYKRNTSNGSVGWNCSTYLTQGKAYCHGKKIPEETLEAVCAEVLGTEGYSPTVFSTSVKRIEVPEDNHLRFVLKDGGTVERTWTDRSRRDSWTPEMRQAAAERTRQRRT